MLSPRYDRAMADELSRLPRGRCRYELVRGELKVEPLRDFQSGGLITEIGCSLFGHVRGHRLGKVWFGTGFQLEHAPDTVLAPAVAFIRRDRVAGTQFFFDGPPDLAVEVMSDDRGKVADWLRAGTRAVIVVDPELPSVRIHRSGNTSRRNRRRRHRFRMASPSIGKSSRTDGGRRSIDGMDQA